MNFEDFPDECPPQDAKDGCGIQVFRLLKILEIQIIKHFGLP